MYIIIMNRSELSFKIALKMEMDKMYNETATWLHVYQMGPHHCGGPSNLMEASQGVSPLPNLHNLQSIT